MREEAERPTSQVIFLLTQNISCSQSKVASFSFNSTLRTTQKRAFLYILESTHPQLRTPRYYGLLVNPRRTLLYRIYSNRRPLSNKRPSSINAFSTRINLYWTPLSNKRPLPSRKIATNILVNVPGISVNAKNPTFFVLFFFLLTVSCYSFIENAIDNHSIDITIILCEHLCVKSFGY